MKKEAINTFTEGMSLDMTPLSTSEKVLTNCLNGTLVTYNGNELTLQNDMGNVPVKTAYLPDGYVPVGMKEYGGIIYVASYNPQTGKGQLGCFPSPLLIYVSEAALTSLDINIQSEFIKFYKGILEEYPVIEVNEYKEEIFKDSITQEPRIFTSGDTFIIKTNNPLSDNLRLAIDDNIITLSLYVIPSNGGNPINITDTLNLYDDTSDYNKKLWIFLNSLNIYENLETPIPFERLINEHREYLQVYPPNVGLGTLEIVIEFNTFKLFNLYEDFSKTGDNLLVLFIGEATPADSVDESTLIPLELVGEINSSGHTLDVLRILSSEYSLEKLEAKTDLIDIPRLGTLYYDIMPSSSYGVLKLKNNNFLKSGELTYEGILNNLNSITSWNFEINSTEALIRWSYIYLDPRKVNHMRFVCIPLDLVLNTNGTGLTKAQINNLYITSPTTSNSSNIFKIEKQYYSGDFEDIFPIDFLHLQPSYIYLVRLDVIYENEVVNGLDYKLLYTGTFFNDKDISLFRADNRPQVQLELNSNITLNSTLDTITYTKLREDETGIHNYPLLEQVTTNDIMFLGDNDKNLNKHVGIIADLTYTVDSKLEVSLNNTAKYENKSYKFNPTFAGIVDSKTALNSILNDQIEFNITSETDFLYNSTIDSVTDELLKIYLEKEEINGINVTLNPTITFTKNSNGEYTNSSTVKIHRGILGKLGPMLPTNVILESLFPVYEPENEEYNKRMFGFTLDSDGNIDNCIYGHKFLGYELKKANEKYGDPLATFNYHKNPYEANASVLNGTKLITRTSEGTTLDEVLKVMGNKVINVIAFNDVQRILRQNIDMDESVRRTAQLCLTSYSADYTYIDGHDHRGQYCKAFRDNTIDWGTTEELPIEDRLRIDVPINISDGITLLWKTQYGPRLVNICTALDVESITKTSPVLTFKKKNELYSGHNRIKVIKHSTNLYPTAATHLRADKMLLCLLSQILIAKCKNSIILLNTPKDYIASLNFNNFFNLNKEVNKEIELTLNGKNIESALLNILNEGVITANDVFIPEFNISSLSCSILCGSNFDINSNKLGQINLLSLFENDEYPKFSTLTDEDRLNIYPGIIKQIKKKYLCELEKDDIGIYKINYNLLDNNNKFDRIFLPTIHSESNKEGATFSCKNYDTYKFMVEGYKYNDALVPRTRIEYMSGLDILELRSEDSDNPYYNLLFLNEIKPTTRNEGFAKYTLFGDLSFVVDTYYLDASLERYLDLDINNWADVMLNIEDGSEETEESEEE